MQLNRINVEAQSKISRRRFSICIRIINCYKGKKWIRKLNCKKYDWNQMEWYQNQRTAPTKKVNWTSIK